MSRVAGDRMQVVEPKSPLALTMLERYPNRRIPRGEMVSLAAEFGVCPANVSQTAIRYGLSSGARPPRSPKEQLVVYLDAEVLVRIDGLRMREGLNRSQAINAVCRLGLNSCLSGSGGDCR